MSQSPTSAEGENEDYSLAWKRLNKMIAQGQSFSGYERNCCFLNVAAAGSAKAFANISGISGFDFPDDARAVAPVDWDLDGDLDLWVTNRSAPRVRFLRNDQPSAGQFVAVRLVGKTCNRDAIGARATLVLGGDEEKRLIQTVRAGCGFLAQASKWVHFGTGPQAQIDQLIVEWPGGEAETFSGLKPGQRYQIVQGSQTAEPLAPADRKLKLAVGPLKLPQPTQKGRSLLASRIPLPELDYQKLDGSTATVQEYSGQPLLINLWASWCQPCIAELNEFKREKQRLDDAGVTVIALSLDALDKDNPAGPETARDLLKRISFPFPAGLATAESVDKLQVIKSQIFSQFRTVAVPSSFLIDSAGQLTGMYIGPVQVDELLEDVKKLELDGERMRYEAIPFAGKWFEPWQGRRLMPVALALVEEGYLDDVSRYVDLGEKQLTKDIDYAKLVGRVGDELYEKGDLDGAMEKYRKALSLDPKLAVVHNNLGRALGAQGKISEAITHYQHALKMEPDLVEARNNLGGALLLRGQAKNAEPHLRAAVRLKPDFADAHYNLGRVLQSQEKLSEANRAYRQALNVDPDYAQAKYALGEILHLQKEFSEAIRHYQKILDADPESSEAHRGLAAALLAQGKTDEAITSYLEALRLNPDDPIAAYWLGSIYFKQNKLNESITYYRQALEQNADIGNAHYHLGAALKMTGNSSEALVHFREAARLMPKSSGALNALARLLAIRPQSTEAEVAEAVQLAEQAVVLTKQNNTVMLDTLAAAYAATGQFDQAVLAAERAIGLAQTQGNTSFAAQVRQRLNLYKQQKAYKEAD